ncbi:RNA-guided endonuclease InsQ/TnpB family protein [Methanobrevibacter sp.]|uniref:RNA-guided endonuclease InsQ/TnpB family protein n=1 Tax=Methanobrevibacter sp. TaxID=66852 RepID=UPI003891118D
MNCVNLGLKVRLYPNEDMITRINQSIGNSRFTWNKLLEEYQNTYKMFKFHGYNKLKCNMTTFNAMLNMLKKEHDFLYLSESSSLQQVYRDLINAFNKFFKGKASYPRFKSKKHDKKSFRIQNNGNIKIKDNTIILPKLGEIHYRTSKKYREKLKNVKINNVTIKLENGKYYALFNIETEIPEFHKTSEFVGIDLGMRTLATLNNGLKIANLDVTYEENMIKKYQKRLSRKKYNSNHYKDTLKTYWKWIDRKKNKINDYYHKITTQIVKNYDIIILEDLDIKEMFQDSNKSRKLQRIAWRKFVEMIKYKAQIYGKTFRQISRWYPSSKNCSECGHYYKDLKQEQTEWKCPQCHTIHDRDINAAKNIQKQGLTDLMNETMNLWDRGDSTVILLSWESTSP